MATRKRHTKEFKLQAVRLLTQSGRPGAEVARELGIRRNQLYKWTEQLKARPHASKA
jgi:transposase